MSIDIDIDNLRERLKNEPKEKKIERLKKAGLIPEPIDWAVIEKVLTSIKEGPRYSVEADDIMYAPGDYSFTSNEFKNVLRWIEDYADSLGKIFEKYNGKFPEFDVYFTYKGEKYHWNLIIGQGSSICLESNPVVFNEDQSFALGEVEKAVPGYHLKKIDKGEMGEWSKVREEFEECEDAIQQDVKVMLLVELSDLIGAVEAYVKKHHNMGLKDLRKMAKVTKRAFESGRRK